jgi:hypothetical protein
VKDSRNRDLTRGAEVILRGRVTSMNDTGDPQTETVTFVSDIPVTPGKPLTFYLRPGQVEIVEETPGVREVPNVAQERADAGDPPPKDSDGDEALKRIASGESAL